MDWLWGHSLEVCTLSVLGALTAVWHPAGVAFGAALGWWLLQEWRLAKGRQPAAPVAALETGRERERA